MRVPVLVIAEMADGSVIEEVASAFEHFTALVLAFRADPDCRLVRWHALG